ncbi:uncharacterized protein K489DRAFT_351790 [Dissoconium aciculare CBS 342.82]|uniref:VanZ-like domain-containing protein n=1 Tax=Dissoconium aciculare CBS 342.82 TaxID=1314786 RepID=A0A6J3M9W9_9PEZI|nr:uncharacterized protein K489DRAFT_351790 [Dissoconium aciculare CBS 342.82]KAF1824835.1 hypothetical protein K489DRAFT_351790 [Dissoconium aciculare CBS 342.82]
MSTIRIRKHVAAVFVGLNLLAAYLGLSTNKIPQYGHSDKGLHFITFFLLTATFYFTLDTPHRRLVLHLTLAFCTAGLSIGSEILQGALPNNNRSFDPYDILANVAGSGIAVLLCSRYHKRMLERMRRRRREGLSDGDEEGGLVYEHHSQETGIVPAAEAPPVTDVTDELDHWDENLEDDDDGEDEEEYEAVDGKKAINGKK